MAIKHAKDPIVQNLIAYFNLQPGQHKRLFQIAFALAKFISDPKGKQQIRTPKRLYHDRKGNCIDYSTFMSSVLTAMGVPHSMRMVSFDEPENFTHIYIVLDDKTILDPTLGQDQTGGELDKQQSERTYAYNQEVPYKYKFDLKVV